MLIDVIGINMFFAMCDDLLKETLNIIKTLAMADCNIHFPYNLLKFNRKFIQVMSSFK